MSAEVSTPQNLVSIIRPDTVIETGRPPARRLPIPEPGRWAAEAFVATHLGHLVERRQLAPDSLSSPVFRGGQQAADRALAALALTEYAARRDEAYPQPRRRVSQLSPWIRHGMLLLSTVWEAATNGTEADVAAFREQLLWQEYARHWYARLGSATASIGPVPSPPSTGRRVDDGAETTKAKASGWDRRLGCLEITLDELEEDGWLPNPTRQWLAGHWTIREQHDWRRGEDEFFRHLLDGSRAANRLGWLLASGAGPEPATGFSRWQVEEHAPGLCASCELVHQCPVEHWPSPHSATSSPSWFDHPLLDNDPDLDRTAGPSKAMFVGQPEVVWLTAESMGDGDPALVAHPELPAVFVFDEALLSKLRLSPKRLIFLTETLSDLATRRDLELWLGDPVAILGDRSLAATFTPVPGWRRRSARLNLAAVHPWPWLRWPHASRIGSFLAWQAGVA